MIHLSSHYELIGRGTCYSLPTLSVPSSPELAHANSEIGGALDLLRATGCDASVTTQASPYNQSVAFPSTLLFRDGQSRQGANREIFRDGVGMREIFRSS